MNLRVKRSLVLLALGGSTLGLFGGMFGIDGLSGCNYAYNADYEALYQAAGNEVINDVSQEYFNFGTDWDRFVRVPTTAFAQSVYANWLDAHIPDDARVIGER